MTSTFYVDGETRINASWLNDLNNLHYILLDNPQSTNDIADALPPADAANAGTMSAQDKIKIDTIETSAKDDQLAIEVPYDNGVSGLAATELQAAVDELAGAGGGVVSSVYGRSGAVVAENNDYTAAQVSYNNVISQLAPNDVQGAIDALDLAIDLKLDATANAISATQLETPRDITLTGDVTGTATFDGTSDSIISTTLQVSTFPTGGIIMWSGAIGSIPAGWNLCDGGNGTPNLVDRFVIAAGGGYAVAATGGTTTHAHTITVDSHVLTTAEMPAHSHSYEAYTGAQQGTGYAATGPWKSSKSTGSQGGNAGHSHTGSSANGPNLPPYYALAYIMKA